MLWRALRHVGEGFYIDVGAADPFAFSVTRTFYDHGWRGINIEPNASCHAALTKARHRDINLRLGAGQSTGQQIFYSIANSGLSTFDREIAARHAAAGWPARQETVETDTLARICHRHRPAGPIHFLKIDVEGTERAVLAGADFATFRPWIVLVEATRPLSSEANHAEWEPLLIGQQYTFVWNDGLNRFYVADEKMSLLQDHFRVQPNIFDGFVPAPQLLERAERAEQDLREASANAAGTAEAVRRAGEAVQQSAASLAQLSSQTAEAERRAADLAEYLAASERQRAALSRQLTELTSSAAGEQELKRRLEAAETALHATLASSSWRMTAPYRLIGRVLKGQVPGGYRTAGKELGRQVFHRGVRGLQLIPGSRRCFAIIRSAVPGPVEWLAMRYRAYEQRIPSVAALGSPAGPTISSDLSEDEARLFRQFAGTGGSSTATA